MNEQEWHKKMIEDEETLRKVNLEMRIIDFKKKLQELNKMLANATRIETNEIRIAKEKAINMIVNLYDSLISEEFELTENQINEYNYYRELSSRINGNKEQGKGEQSR